MRLSQANIFGFQGGLFGLEFSNPIDALPLPDELQPVTLRSGSPHWCTPKEIAGLLDAFGGVKLDPFGNEYSVVRAERVICPPQNSLLLPWAADGLNFANPPYGDDLPSCAEKIGYEARVRRNEIITLVPARVDTDWWQNALDPNMWIAITHRLRFLEPAQTLLARYEARAAAAKQAGRPVPKKPRIRMVTEHLAEGESATFPAALTYHGKRPQKFLEVFGHLGIHYKKGVQSDRRKKWEKARDKARARIRGVRL